MKRIVVIGSPGSGKSTLSGVLQQKTGIPLCHLDMMYWNADKTVVERDVFLARLAAVLERDTWILDGNYATTMEMRVAACDTVIFLDYSPEVCLEGIQKRRGKPRSDMPWIEREEDVALTDFVRTFREQQRPRILALLEKYPEKKIFVFTTREQANAFLRE